MTNKEESQLVVTDLPIALYLNQQVTFDILAADSHASQPWKLHPLERNRQKFLGKHRLEPTSLYLE